MSGSRPYISKSEPYVTPHRTHSEPYLSHSGPFLRRFELSDDANENVGTEPSQTWPKPAYFRALVQMSFSELVAELADLEFKLGQRSNSARNWEEGRMTLGERCKSLSAEIKRRYLELGGNPDTAESGERTG